MKTMGSESIRAATVEFDIGERCIVSLYYVSIRSSGEE